MGVMTSLQEILAAKLSQVPTFTEKEHSVGTQEECNILDCFLRLYSRMDGATRTSYNFAGTRLLLYWLTSSHEVRASSSSKDMYRIPPYLETFSLYELGKILDIAPGYLWQDILRIVKEMDLQNEHDRLF